MMVKNRVPELLATKFGGAEQVNLKQVERDTGLTYSTVSRWAKDQIDRADFPTLSIWCDYLRCETGDILVYVPEDRRAG